MKVKKSKRPVIRTLYVSNLEKNFSILLQNVRCFLSKMEEKDTRLKIKVAKNIILVNRQYLNLFSFLLIRSNIKIEKILGRNVRNE